MDTYIATFFSHFGAIRFHKKLEEQNIEAVLMPVPRKVSSSCGTCVKFTADSIEEYNSQDIDSLYHMEEDGTISLIFSNL